MGKRTLDDIDRRLLDIRQLKDANNTDQQIMESLAIPPATYHRYLARIHKQNKEAWLLLTRDELETELLKLKGSLEHTYQRALELSNKEDYEVLDALQAKDDARLSIVQLLVEGPEWLKKVEGLLGGSKKKTRTVDTEPEEQAQATT